MADAFKWECKSGEIVVCSISSVLFLFAAACVKPPQSSSGSWAQIQYLMQGWERSHSVHGVLFSLKRFIGEIIVAGACGAHPPHNKMLVRGASRRNSPPSARKHP